MTWQPVSVQLPQSLQTIQGQQAATLGSIPAEVSDAKTRLQDINGLPTITTHSLATAGLSPLRDQLAALTGTGGHVLAIHPWLQGVNQEHGLYRHLSPAAAVEQLANKCRQLSDARLPAAQEAVALIFYAADMKTFTQQLASFNTVFPVPDLQLAERRSASLVNHEQTKRHILTAPTEPHWRKNRFADLPKHQAMDKRLGSLQAALESYAGDINPISELIALADKKSALHAQKMTAWDALNAALQGGSGQAFYTQQSNLQAIANTIEKSAPAGHEYPLTAAVLWVGGNGDLQLIKEVLGL